MDTASALTFIQREARNCVLYGPRTKPKNLNMLLHLEAHIEQS